MNPQIQEMLDAMGVTPEVTGLLITITALSGAFYFVLGIIQPILTKISTGIKAACYREIEVYIADPDFNKFNLWLTQNDQYTWFRRSYKVVPGTIEDEGEYGAVACDSDHFGSKSLLATGYGTVLIKAPGFPFVLVTRAKEENKNVFKQTETLRFKILSLRQVSMEKFFAQVTAIKSLTTGPKIHKSSDSYWYDQGRPKHVLPPLGAAATELIKDVGEFLAAADEYRRRGIAHKRGYLLAGPPGTGKTSIVSHLSHHYGMDIYNVTSDGLIKFDNLIQQIVPNSIVLIEDIDMTIAGKGRSGLMTKNKRRRSGNVIAIDDDGMVAPQNLGDDDTIEGVMVATYTQDIMREFLNALDGICRFDGSIIIATSNSPDSLDAALLRPGRIDRRIDIEAFSHLEQIQHINRFYGVSLNPNNFTHLAPRTFAEIQFICISNMNNLKATMSQLT